MGANDEFDNNKTKNEEDVLVKSLDTGETVSSFEIEVEEMLGLLEETNDN